MKPRTAKQSEQIMRFFTPELYLRFNSADERVADEANEAWENAVASYRKHIEHIRGQMPEEVKKLADSCFHDSVLLAFDPRRAVLDKAKHCSRPPGDTVAILSIEQESGVVSLFYVLEDHIRAAAASGKWPFSTEHVHWLYDEIDVEAQAAGFVHRILFSDGRTLEIPFVSVIKHDVPLADVRGGLQQSA